MSKEHLEEFCAPSSKHVEFTDRVRKTLYYGQYSDRSLPSLAVTDVAVEVIGSVATAKRRRLDTNYAMAVSRRAKISPCTLMMGILYSERLRQKNPEYLRRVSSSDLFLISVMVASKYLYDEGEDEEVFNDDWARAGSKSVNDVNQLEMEFLASIDWSLFISNEDFLDFVNKVESRVAATHGLYRGWFTYGDLSTLLDNSGFLHTLSTARIDLLKVLCACAMAYVLSISLASSVTMLASRHYYHVHRRLAPERATPCLTTESACRSHRPAVIKVMSSLWLPLHDTLMKRKGNREMQNNSWISRQSRTSLEGYVHDERAIHSEDNNARLVPEKTKTVSQPSFHRQLTSNRSKLLKSGNMLELSEGMPCKCTHGVSSCPPCLPSQMSSRNLVLQQSLLSMSSVNSLVTSLAQNNFVFSNFSQGSRNSNHRLSYICVA